MIEVLDELNSLPGISGSLVATPDGIVVASRLRGSLDPDTAAALVSSLLAGAQSVVRQCGDGGMSRLVMVATRGKVIVTDLGNAYLVVVTDRHIDLDQGLLDIESAAKTLRKLGQITV